MKTSLRIENSPQGTGMAKFKTNPRRRGGKNTSRISEEEEQKVDEDHGEGVNGASKLKDVSLAGLTKGFFLLLKGYGGRVQIKDAATELGVGKNKIDYLIDILCGIGLVRTCDDVVELNPYFTLTEKRGIEAQESSKETTVTLRKRNKDGVLCNITRTVTTTLKITKCSNQDLPEDALAHEDANPSPTKKRKRAIVQEEGIKNEIGESDVSLALTWIHQNIQIERAKRQLMMLDHYNKYMETQIARLVHPDNGNLSKLYLSLAELQTVLGTDSGITDQVLLLRGPDGAELQVSDNKEKIFQMKLSSPTNVPLEAFLVREDDGLADIFQAGARRGGERRREARKDIRADKNKNTHRKHLFS
mmetsp:Transcript_24049/g.38647  ORF Transcript_24049/g.38647 Transcript_24049/m.38647 type:complete len:360 (-) Transcript_24049:4148-5227(-)|eukprot:CAMPEP_0203770362 /NCGR_PEP_ID=MMETSP0099_2-20121227/2766_1 /ASSEMBLY_ACC=CAM_ASM_000209 /TAXON_ID=96639 /ORGANISM=" , Strain NY0313808BC1" /LENGTH=359 /DNA_ID=CAMNT_0050667485 /DNA_START=199 /DNA_END=1278 /DNA_ORIENTATION=+